MNQRWLPAPVQVRKLERQISLEELKSHAGPAGPLASMALIKYGRLSVQPVTAAEWAFVVGLEGQPAPPTAAKGRAGAKGKAAVAAAEDAGGGEQAGDVATAEGSAAAKGRGKTGSSGRSRGSKKRGS